MLYVERNEVGKIVAVLREASRPDMESKLTVDSEILDFLGEHIDRDAVLQLLASMDTGVIRVVEDLIDLLIKKNIIMLTELPEEAQEKLISRQRVRQRIGKDSIIVDDIL